MTFCKAAEPVERKKRKGKASRPLRIDLILQNDSLVPPPKESVWVLLSFNGLFNTPNYSYNCGTTATFLSFGGFN